MLTVLNLYISMQSTAAGLASLAQPFAIGEVILFGKETSVAIMPALHDVQGKAGEMDAGATGHSGKNSSVY